jgi:hypothetical protein
VAEGNILSWEETNAPYKLPEDYKAFLQIFDGLNLTWKFKNDQLLPLGCIHLNRLRDIKQIPVELDTDSDSDEEAALEDSVVL